MDNYVLAEWVRLGNKEAKDIEMSSREIKYSGDGYMFYFWLQNKKEIANDYTFSAFRALIEESKIDGYYVDIRVLRRQGNKEISRPYIVRASGYDKIADLIYAYAVKCVRDE